jgi:aryl-alcohol dehydrogenase-like predicted oxidoreductase
MERRTLGSTDLTIAPLVLGAINFGMPTELDEATRIVDRALDGGINMIDVADVYADGESEKMLGAIFDANGRRDDVVLATKVGYPRDDADPGQWHRREHILRSCEQSLVSLRTDRIDLYQLHRPSLVGIPLEETLGAFGELVEQGKVRYVGCSTHAAWMVMEALATSERLGLPRYVSEQPPYNLLDRRIENELLPLCAKYDLGVIPWGSIGQGILGGRYVHGIPAGSRAERLDALKHRITPEALAAAERLGTLAAERGLTSAQLALVWCKDQPGITAPIVGPRTLEHLEDSLGALDVSLDDDARAACDELVAPGGAVADFHSSSRWTKPLRLPAGA